jgi:hypothetical protein
MEFWQTDASFFEKRPVSLDIKRNELELRRHLRGRVQRDCRAVTRKFRLLAERYLT